MMNKFSISTNGNNDVINITPQVVKQMKKVDIQQGICLISSPGSTCGITTIEYEPNLIKDFKQFLEKLAPADKDYHHDQTWQEKNGQSHLLSAIYKPFLTVPIKGGKLALGQWQQIVFVDFDSRAREREVIVTIV